MTKCMRSCFRSNFCISKRSSHNLFYGWYIQISLWKEDLNRAVEKEEYEVAADIRDKINELEKNIDRKTVEEITQALRSYNSQDPIAYDFALFGIGIKGIFK